MNKFIFLIKNQQCVQLNNNKPIFKIIIEKKVIKSIIFGFIRQ